MELCPCSKYILALYMIKDILLDFLCDLVLYLRFIIRVARLPHKQCALDIMWV